MKGVYKPKKPEKYRGDPTKIVYRSSWELKFMSWCDRTTSVLEWSSETVVVQYRTALDEANERKKNLNYKIYHRYFIDFYVKLKLRDGTTKRWLVEVKPLHQTKPPELPASGKKTPGFQRAVKTWIVNSAKWEAAREFAADRNMEFKLITEKDLYGQ